MDNEQKTACSRCKNDMPMDTLKHAHDGVIKKECPEYIKIYKELREKITSFRLLPHEKIPSETELCRQYGVSRYTIQRALQLLVAEGLIIRQQGKASYVRELARFGGEEGEKQVLHLGCLNQPEILLTQFACRFARRVEEKTAGALHVEVHHSSELGDGSEEIMALSRGELDLFCGALDWLALLNPVYAVVSFPFLFRDIDHLMSFVCSAMVTDIRKRFVLEHGICVLAANWYRPSRVLLSRSPVFSPRDWQGLSIGIPNIPLFRDMWTYLGMTPEPVSFGERHSAFDARRIEATDVNWDIIISEQLYECVSFVTCMNHSFSRACVAMSERCFRSLRPDMQHAVKQAAEDVGSEYSQHLFSSFENEKKQMLAKGMHLISTNMGEARQLMTKFFYRESRKHCWPENLYRYIQSL
ncbi:TRAP transporter substrate-binding protein DctP [Desulfovibrio sp.]|uniref:TRAP transporter substrate-binding protein DctP n=1 Tax=Desulfovibrio sp. TaxID=885 RepID=UPI003078AF9D